MATTSLPFRALAVVFFVQLSEAFQLMTLGPFISFMVASFDETPEEFVSAYTGVLIAGFAFGQLLTSVVWGHLSDRFGARPCVLVSLLLTCICEIVLGFSYSYPMALSVRIFTGLSNGALGIIKSYLGKVTDGSNQAQAMALMSAAWAVASIVAPFLGGFFSEPTVQYPGVFSPDGVFATYPYLLPCLFASFLNFASFLCCGFIMKEADAVLAEMAEARLRGPSESTLKHAWNQAQARVRSLGITRAYSNMVEESPPLDSSNDEIATAYIDQDAGNLDIDGQDSNGGLRQRRGVISSAEPYDDSVYSDLSVNGENRLFSSRVLWFCTFMYATVALFYTWIDELVPFFMRDTFENGGLNFTPSEIGLALSFLGIVSIVYNVFVFPIISKKLGLMSVLRYSLIFAIPMVFLYPCVNLIAQGGSTGGTWTLLLFVCSVRAIVGLNMFTPVMVFINNSVPRHMMGTANGLGQTWASAVNAFGPAVGGLLWSLTANARFSGHTFIIWLIMAVLAACQLVLTRSYPKSIVKPFDDQNLRPNKLVHELQQVNTMLPGQESLHDER